METKDVFGIAPYGEALKISVERAFDSLSCFLGIVFKPGLEELGFMLKDQVRLWRVNNILSVIDKAKGKINFDRDNFQLQLNPRIGLSIIDGCSMVDDEDLQNLWAGLFASSCSPEGRDDSNIIFIDILKRLSSVEVKILSYACEHCPKLLCQNGLIVAGKLNISLQKLQSISGINDIDRLDREMDHLSSLSLLTNANLFASAGFSVSDENLTACITPSALALNLYYKTHAVNISIKDYWKDELVLNK